MKFDILLGPATPQQKYMEKYVWIKNVFLPTKELTSSQ